MSFLMLIVAIVVLFGIGRFIFSFILGVPLVFWDKIQEYRKGEMDKKEIKQWRGVFILMTINTFFIIFIALGMNKSN